MPVGASYLSGTCPVSSASMRLPYTPSRRNDSVQGIFKPDNHLLKDVLYIIYVTGGFGVLKKKKNNCKFSALRRKSEIKIHCMQDCERVLITAQAQTAK